MQARSRSPSIAELVRTHELAARKSLGQNFLYDERLIAKIAAATGPLDGVNLVEVGPGPGGLTRALLAAGCGARGGDRARPPLSRRLAGTGRIR